MKQNYGKYSKSTTERTSVDVQDTNITYTAEQLNAENTAEETVQPEVEKKEAPKPEPKKGAVACSLLNVRKFPTLNGEVITKLKQGAEVTIDPEYETVEWLKVLTAAGQEGYCMKKFIEIK